MISEPINMLELARLEEGRLAQAAREMAPQWRPFAGGTLGRGHPGSWFNTAYGVGLDGPVTAEEVDAFIEWHASAGIEPRAELSPFADPTLVQLLADRGFVVRQFEIVSYRALSAGSPALPVYDPPPDLRIEVVDPRNEAEVDEFARIALSGFLPPGMEATEELLENSRRAACHERTVAIRATLGGKCVGAGAMAVSGEIASLWGLTVLEPWRRRGVQQAMMAWRLNEAASQGARFATICSRPGAATDRNARRMGFHVAYVRTVLVRPGEGLAPVVE